MPSTKLADHIDIEQLQTIQDNCSLAMGVALVAVDYRGVPVTRYSGFTRHCSIARNNPETCKMCEQCDAHGGIRSTMTGDPCLYRCYEGLVDFAVPLIFDGTYLGAMLGGQVRLSEEDVADLDDIVPAQKGWESTPELRAAYDEAPLFTRQRLEAAIDTTRDIVLYAVRMSEDKRLNEQLESRSQELEDLRAENGDLEFALKRCTDDGRQSEEVFRHFYFAMNAIRSLSSEEGATRTEDVVLDYTDMVRYLTDTDAPVTTLGEEVDYCRAFLRVWKAWYGDALTYDVRIPSRLRGISCPFMTLQPMVEAAISGIGDLPGRERTCDVEVVECDGVVEVRVVGDGRSAEEVRTILRGGDRETPFSLANANRAVRKLSRTELGIQVSSRADGSRGCEQTLTLPLDRG